MSQGSLIANWYVSCNLCTNTEQISRPRTTSVKKIESRLRQGGWRYRYEYVMGDRTKVWTCPSCVEASRRFLKR